MTPQERHAYLIKLGTEAVSIALLDHAASDDHDSPEALSRRIRAHMSERMAQVAMVWGGEVDEGEDAEDAPRAAAAPLVLQRLADLVEYVGEAPQRGYMRRAARKFGITPEHLCRVLSGKGPYTRTTVAKVASACQLDLTYFEQTEYADPQRFTLRRWP